jgi:hypothetical protein
MDLIIQAKEINEGIIKIDRDKYQPFLDIAKAYAIENNIYILDVEAYRYTFYAVDAFKKSLELCDRIFKSDKTGLSRYCKVMTKIKFYLFSIIVDERELITLTNVSSNLSKIVKPIYMDGLLYLGNDIKNVIALEKLSSPAHEKDWTNVIDSLEFKVDFNIDYLSISGGSSNEEQPLAKNEVIKLIYDKFIKNSNYVLIGSAAINKDEILRLQIISPNDFSEDIKILEPLLKKYKFGYNITELKFITDIRLKRMTVYIGDKVPVMDVFDNAKYEVVPYIDGDIKIGSDFVLMRFRLIDFWTVKVLLSMNSIPANYAKILINNIERDYNILCKRVKINENVKYIGHFDDINISIKRKFTDIIFPYFPLLKLTRQ